LLSFPFLSFASAHQPQAKEKKKENGRKKRRKAVFRSLESQQQDEVVACWRGSCLPNAFEAMHIECALFCILIDPDGYRCHGLGTSASSLSCAVVPRLEPERLVRCIGRIMEAHGDMLCVR
jgi:hypothetical protein